MTRLLRPWLGAWLPVGLWAGLIFWGSTGLFASSETSRLIRPLVLWLHPGASDALVGLVQTVARKGWHLTEYAVLTAGVWRAVGRPPGIAATPTHRAILAWAWAVTYAVSDEFHQSFVDGREGALRDVGFDALGAGLAATALLLMAGRRR